MKKNTIFIQLGLISIGVVLVFFFYFYPNMEANKLKKKTIQKEIAENEIDTNTKNEFTNVIYKGKNSGNLFTIQAEKAKIRRNVNLIHMENMFITIFFKDGEWIIECETGTYNKFNYDIFCSQNMKATSSDGKTTIYSQNLDLIADESSTIYNKVSIIDKEGLSCNRIEYFMILKVKFIRSICLMPMKMLK